MAFKMKNLSNLLEDGKGRGAKVSQQDSPLNSRQKPLELMYCLRFFVELSERIKRRDMNNFLLRKFFEEVA